MGHELPPSASATITPAMRDGKFKEGTVVALVESLAVDTDEGSSGIGSDVEDANEAKLAARPKLSRELAQAYEVGMRNFLVVYGARAGLALLLQAVKLLRKGNVKVLFSLDQFLGEKQLPFRVEAVSLGILVGGLSGGSKAIQALLRHGLAKLFPTLSTVSIGKFSSLASGAIAAALVAPAAGKYSRFFVLYVLSRALQSLYNIAKQRKMWHFWGSDWNHGDALLFALSNAQLMYGCVMRPDSVARGFYRFVLNVSPVEADVLQVVRQANRNLPIDTARLQRFVERKGMKLDFPLPQGCPDMISCRFVHHQTESCMRGIVDAFKDTYLISYPFYVTIFMVPTLLFKLKRLQSAPVQTLFRVFTNAARSNLFLAAYNAIYISLLCGQRRVVTKDHRFYYYLMGFGASSAIFFEPKHRRSEIAMYMLPRALDVVYCVLRDHHLAPSFKHGERMVFAVSMAILTYCYQHERDSMDPIVSSTLQRVLESSSSASTWSPPHLHASP
ncbi:hypothetical protein Poli38472_007815 [Pythium oligandrum]|uniref:Transmembrane protein 135 N-terminal domain-containing protein n=1 Tax=Pythium oligandrum TaxID=41045 RepID=A0A8K1FS23_PYTOL|nr:hypothetical protein Poli38472_007815 [Pythium oligandrum]|eukprot:TMW68143.1 hypothetical protein Poli38472_007815 [Pythium oligandrum]